MSESNSEIKAPYLGLRPFEEMHHPIFFGRERQIIAMLRILAQGRFVAVVGSSGSGKSSLVRAGLVPAIRRGFLAGTKNWLIIPPVKPGNDPYGRLVSGLMQCREETLSAHSGSSPADLDKRLNEILRATDRGFLDALATLELDPDQRVMLIVDQFEELFSFRNSRQSRANAVTRDEAAAFVSMLLRSCEDPEGRIWVVLTMRSDFIGHCEAFLGLPEKISQSQFLVPRLDRAQMAEAIARPGEAAGLGFTPFGFEEGLVNQIINDAGDIVDQLPLMQHALMRSWKTAAEDAQKCGKPIRISIQNYGDNGRIAGALNLDADKALKEIREHPGLETTARQLLLLLCDEAPDGQMIRHRPLVKDVLKFTGADLGTIEKILRIFQTDDRNFVLPPLEGTCLREEDHLDISHEALLRQWVVFRAWQEKEKLVEAELSRLKQQAKLFQEKNEEVLKGRSLERVNDWQATTSWEWISRYVSAEEWEMIKAFIRESNEEVKREEKKREDEKEKIKQNEDRLIRGTRKTALWLFILSLAIGSCISFFAYKENQKSREAGKRSMYALKQAIDAKSELVAEQVNGYYNSIGSSDLSISKEEVEVLWKLSALTKDSESIRTELIEKWFSSPEAFARGSSEGNGLLTAVALSANRREMVEPYIKKYVQSWIERDHGGGEYPLAHADVMIGLISDHAADELADLVLKKIETESKEEDRVSDLTGVLIQLTNKVGAGSAERFAERLIQALENTSEIHHVRVTVIASALNDLLGGLEMASQPTIARRAVEKLFRTLEQHSNNDGLVYLSDALKPIVNLINRCDDSWRADTARKTLQFTIEQIASRSDQSLYPSVFDDSRASLEQLARLSGNELSLAQAKRLLGVLENTQDVFGNHSILVVCLDALIGRLDGTVAAGLAKRAADRLLMDVQVPQLDEDVTSRLQQCLVSLTNRFDADAASVLATESVGVIESSGEPTSRGSVLLGISSGLLAKVDEKTAALLATRLAKVLTDRSVTDPTRLRKLSTLLVALKEKTAEPVTSEIALRLALAMQSGDETNEDRFYCIAVGLGKFAAALEPGAAEALAGKMAGMLENETSPERFAGSAIVLAMLVNRADIRNASELAGDGLRELIRGFGKIRWSRPTRVIFPVESFRIFAKIAPKSVTDHVFEGVFEVVLNGGDYGSPSFGTTLGWFVYLWDFVEDKSDERLIRFFKLLSESLPESDSLSDESIIHDRLFNIFPIDLASLSTKLPQGQREIRRWAVARLLKESVSEMRKDDSDKEVEPEDRKAARKLCEELPVEDLTDILKWPFCQGEAQKVVLAEIEKKTGAKFNGDIWKFVEMAPALGIKTLEEPARRPSLQKAIQELDASGSKR